MARIVECVPNISDGVHPEVYNAVARACEKVNGVQLLDVDPGIATNRTVITFAGAPEKIVDGAFEVIKASKELIDMREHRGEHARMGATDVCPFVPVSEVTLEECAGLARKLAKRVGEELGVWVYLYESAATKREWQSLPNVRKGEYEGLADRVGNPEWRPDAGPERFDPKFGAVAIGARKFLIAYNINFNSKNLKMAKDIAFNIRQSGRSKRAFYPDGAIVRKPDGTPVKIPGIFNHCKAGAWVIPEYNRAQVTMNLTDIDVTPVHEVFDEVAKQAQERGMRVTGSEIVGLVPLQVLLEAGRYYARKQGLSAALSEAELIEIASLTMGLSDVSPFVPDEKIVECRFKRKEGLANMACSRFVDALASDAPAPGGGSAAALCGSVATALAVMVANLTYGKPEHKEHWENMERLGIEARLLQSDFLEAVDRDTDSFNAVMEAMRLPKQTEEQKTARKTAIVGAYRKCTQVPLNVVENCVKAIPILEEVAKNGNPNCASDAGVGVHCLLACAEGAALNVRINLAAIEDETFRTECRDKMNRALSVVRTGCRDIIAWVEKKL